MTDEPDQQIKAAFAADGVIHAKEARSAPYAGPKLVDQPPIAVEGRNGERPSIPQGGTTILGARTAIQELEPTDPQAIFNQALALSAMGQRATTRAWVAAVHLLHNDARPSKGELADVLAGLDELATRAVQLRHSLSTHA